MAYRSAQSYSLYDTIMRNRRANRLPARSVVSAPTTPTLTDKAVSGTRLPGTGAVRLGTTGPVYSDFMDPSKAFVTEDAGIRTMGADQYSNLSQYGQIGEKLTTGEAATQSRTGYFGPVDPDTSMGKFVYGVTQAITTPFLGDLMGGTTTVDPYGKTAAIPLGMLGAIARKNIEKQYEIAGYIQQGREGYHQFYSGGQLVSIVPQENPITGQQTGYTVLGTTSGSPQSVINQYASMYGYDPASVDLSKRPGQRGFGIELESFVPGTGGFTRNGEFVDVLGRTETNPTDVRAQLGLINDVYGADQALNQLNKMELSDDVRTSLMDSIQQGEMTAEKVVNSDGSIVGFNTGTGGVVRSTDGIVTSANNKPVTSGTGILSYESFNRIQQQEKADESVRQARKSNPKEATKFDTLVSEGSGGAPEGYSPEGAETAGGFGSPFAEGGFVNRKPMQEGGEAPVVAEAGFIGDEPEGLPDGMTVADDVPVDVPEGTFVLNAAAVEFMGSADVKKMILEAIAEAERQGIDISQRNDTIPKEELVSLVVSRGEVIIPPALSKIIGYDRLNKINNRGKAEVERRVEENGEEQPQERVAAAEGGDTRGMIDLEDVVDYRDFKNPQSSLMNMLEVTGAGVTGNLEAMEKAFSYSRKWNQRTKSGDNYEDSFRHALVGGLYGDVGSFYADAKENWHKYAEAYPKIGYEKAKGMLGGQTNEEQIDIARSIIAESDVDLNNNAFGRQLRKQIPNEEEYVRTMERMMNIAVTEGIDKVPSITTEDGEQLRLQLSTVPAE